MGRFTSWPNFSYTTKYFNCTRARIVDRVFPLEDTSKAIAYLESGQARAAYDTVKEIDLLSIRSSPIDWYRDGARAF